MPRELEAKIPIAAAKEASPLTKIIKTNTDIKNLVQTQPDTDKTKHTSVISHTNS